jgi:hypothetical protein
MAAITSLPQLGECFVEAASFLAGSFSPMPVYFDSSVKKRDSVFAKEEEELFREENKIGYVLAGSRSFRDGDHGLRWEEG